MSFPSGVRSIQPGHHVLKAIGTKAPFNGSFAFVWQRQDLRHQCCDWFMNRTAIKYPTILKKSFSPQFFNQVYDTWSSKSPVNHGCANLRDMLVHGGQCRAELNNGRWAPNSLCSGGSFACRCWHQSVRGCVASTRVATSLAPAGARRPGLHRHGTQLLRRFTEAAQHHKLPDDRDRRQNMRRSRCSTGACMYTHV